MNGFYDSQKLKKKMWLDWISGWRDQCWTWKKRVTRRAITTKAKAAKTWRDRPTNRLAGRLGRRRRRGETIMTMTTTTEETLPNVTWLLSLCSCLDPVQPKAVQNIIRTAFWNSGGFTVCGFIQPSFKILTCQVFSVLFVCFSFLGDVEDSLEFLRDSFGSNKESLGIPFG